MKAHRKAILAIALVLSGGLMACDTATTIESTTSRPSYSQGGANGKKKSTAQLLAAVPGWSEACVVAKITPSGGTVTLGQSVQLVVPRKAVVEPLTFSICPRNDGFLSYDFIALDNHGNEVHEFQNALRATFSYANALSVPDESALRILYLINGQPIEILSGTIDRRNKTVTVSLQHFSWYAVGLE